MTTTQQRPLWAGRTLALLGIFLVALDLRTAVAALSPIVDEISAELALTPTIIGVLGMLPPVCFAVFGILSPAFTRRFGLEPVLIAAIIAMVVGHLARGFAPNAVLLLVGSAITFAGLGVGNVLLPPLVKKYFPDRVGLVTSVYVTLLSFSTFIPALVAVPVADSAGWRVSLGMWAIFAFAALIPWVALVIRHRTGSADPQAEHSESALMGRVWHSSIAWALAVVFAVSSLNAYAMFAWLPSLLDDTAGTTPAQAGVLLSLFAAMGLPAGLLIPWLATRMRNVGILVYAGVVFFIVGYLGLLLVPATATWLWVAFAGAGPLLFPLALVLINLRTRTHAGSVALSGFVQGVGYTIGAVGPLVVGILHETSGGWTVPLVFLMATAVAGAFAGVVVARPHLLEDAHERRQRRRSA
ncbi:CynX/NimT family MFS transporter [Leifsonia flava]|uniref:MFS transporter n=1 Tax=Orlajensenia leifsoniae TaxID=2561933 RepID=A0A4Y9QVU1_9MICO|nr:MFS transporter [Leifsonia flava]TFV96330.1 MFS transporter [Leifsonia flava]